MIIQLRFDQVKLCIDFIRLHFILCRETNIIVIVIFVTIVTPKDPSVRIQLAHFKLQFNIEMASKQFHVRYFISIMLIQDAYFLTLNDLSSYQIKYLNLLRSRRNHAAIQ